jgi:hypothetical protein
MKALHDSFLPVAEKDCLKYTKEAVINTGLGCRACKIYRLFFTALFRYYAIILGAL